MIVGTAGHTDHGKTALVRAITGVDTDRLEEEKRRGITIELGFAPMRLGDGTVVSIVDVPGHERFVDTMAAGAWPLDAAVLVVAATEGVMPQTREHCAILRAYRVPVIAIALTNVDRVGGTELSRAEASVRAALQRCGVGASVPLIRTVAPQSEGVDAVRSAIAATCARTAPCDANDLARFVVDRAFTLRGIGTVVTGTMHSGSLRVGERVRTLPHERESRIRGIHVHGESVGIAAARARYALALADVAPDDVPRATTLVTDDAWRATTRLVVRLEAQGPVVPRGVVLHLACASTPARVTIVDSALGVARLSLARPVVARAGDAALLRVGAGDEGIVGAEILDPFPDRHVGADRRDASPSERLEVLATAAGARGLACAALPIRLGVSPARAAGAVFGAQVIPVRDRVFSVQVVAATEERIVRSVADWTAEHPFAAGVSIGELGTLANVDPLLVPHLVERMVARGQLRRDHGIVAPAAASELPNSSALLLARVLHAVSAAGLEPPTVAELQQTFGGDVEAVVRHAERAGNLIRVGDVRCYAAPVLSRAIDQLGTAMRDGGEYSPSALRDVLGVSRKYLIPLLEYCDSIRVTERRSGGRVLVDVSSR